MYTIYLYIPCINILTSFINSARFEVSTHSQSYLNYFKNTLLSLIFKSHNDSHYKSLKYNLISKSSTSVKREAKYVYSRSIKFI